MSRVPLAPSCPPSLLLEYLNVCRRAVLVVVLLAAGCAQTHWHNPSVSDRETQLALARCQALAGDDSGSSRRAPALHYRYTTFEACMSGHGLAEVPKGD